MIIKQIKDTQISKPWGEFFMLWDNSNFRIKQIFLNSNSRFSYHYHNSVDEIWIIQEGKLHTIVDNEEKICESGDIVIIPRLVKHRAKNISDGVAKILEIQIGENPNEESDIVRIIDDYGRR